MDYSYQRRRAAPGRAAPSSPAAAAPQYRSMPNSAFPAASQGGMGKDALREAMRARMSALRHQIPSAETEADQLSQGVTGTTPEQIRTEMGGRMGADFSGVRFHSDAASASRAEEMGANAWTQGNDVYFGAGGFSPSTTAHELVHTVQQGVVESGVSTVSAPMGGVQMEPKWKESGYRPQNVKKMKHFLNRPEKLSDEDFTNTVKGGAVNKVYQYNQGWYKPTTADTVDNNDPVMKDAGIKKGVDGMGFENRNLAASLLDEMLGTNVLVKAKRARVGSSTNAQQNTEGILMENAPGYSAGQLNWNAFKPDFKKISVQDSTDKGVWKSARAAAHNDNSWSTLEYRDKGDVSKGYKTYQEKLDEYAQKNPDVRVNGWKRETVNAKKPENANAKEALDVADPGLQKAMSDLNVIDFLMMNPDRHSGNFKIDVDQQSGKFKSVKGIDNDASFGLSRNMFQSKGYLNALPKEMHIDANTAQKIMGTSDKELEQRFGRYIRPDEVAALKARFHRMQDYIQEMQEIDKKSAAAGSDKRLIVNEWNERTAKEQLNAAHGRGLMTDYDKSNTYYQKLVASLAVGDKNLDWF